MRAKRSKASAGAEPSRGPEGAAESVADGASPVVMQDPAVMAGPAVMEVPPVVDAPAMVDAPATGDHPAGRRGSGGSLRRLYTVPERQSAQERDRQAAEEFAQAVSPATDLLRQAVPGAGTPEEAAQALAASLGEYIPDPDGGAYVAGDAFGEDRRVYYRLLHRDYHPDPRPRGGRRGSHRLHDRPQLLPGTRGW